MVSALPALLLLTFSVAAVAFTPAPSPTASVDISGQKLLAFGDPTKCWQFIGDVQGCTEQLVKSLVEKNVKFLPACCKVIGGLPTNCFTWIFPLPIFGISFSDQINKFCSNLLGGDPLPDS